MPHFKTSRLLACLPALLLLTSTHVSSAAKPAEPAEEMRGIWVARWSMESPQAIRNVVAAAVKNHYNALFVQVRGRGDAWYSSDLEPRAEQLAKQPASFDPLQTVITEGHKAGLKVHAWMNTYLVWTGAKGPKSPRHVLNAHPEWIARDQKNRFTTTPGPQVEGVFLSASNPAVQDHLYSVFTNVAARYDVDGIHFDFVRYPGPDYDYSDGALARFRKYLEEEKGVVVPNKPKDRLAAVHAFPKEWAVWRRTQVTNTVQRISEGIHERKPWVEVSAAVFANHEDALAARGQDWPTWLKNGTLDAVCPMAYSTDTAVVAKQIRFAVKAAEGRHVYAGLGSWRLPASDTAKKVAAVRALGAQGIVLFSYDGVTKAGQSMEYLGSLTRSTFASRAGYPKMKWRPWQSGSSTPKNDGDRENQDR